LIKLTAYSLINFVNPSFLPSMQSNPTHESAGPKTHVSTPQQPSLPSDDVAGQSTWSFRTRTLQFSSTSGWEITLSILSDFASKFAKNCETHYSAADNEFSFRMSYKKNGMLPQCHKKAAWYTKRKRYLRMHIVQVPGARTIDRIDAIVQPTEDQDIGLLHIVITLGVNVAETSGLNLLLQIGRSFPRARDEVEIRFLEPMSDAAGSAIASQREEQNLQALEDVNIRISSFVSEYDAGVISIATLQSAIQNAYNDLRWDALRILCQQNHSSSVGRKAVVVARLAKLALDGLQSEGRCGSSSR
jgi:hypothetical protein